MIYNDMIIEASDATRVSTPDKRRQGRFKVRVFQSPAGAMKPEDAVEVLYDDTELRKSLASLEGRTLDHEGLVALGRTLAALLLPPAARQSAQGANPRDLFRSSLLRIGQDGRIRLRLRLPAELAALPWEYLYVDRACGGDGMDGFVALDPQVAIVRDEALPLPSVRTQSPGNIKIVAAFASNIELPLLDLDRERTCLEEALTGQDGVEGRFLEKATLQEIQDAIVSARVFHFAGHGVFAREMGEEPGTYVGTGGLALEDQYVDAEQLGINLCHQGVRLAVLGGCETGRRGGAYVWSAVAPALMKAEIPAVVANQYSILDKCAIAFSRAFYKALVGGLSIEAAVSAGRIAIYNADRSGRDWGVPVLYLRAENGLLFEGAADNEVREKARGEAEAEFSVRAKNVMAGGKIIGADVAGMLDGKLTAEVTVSGKVFGKVVGIQTEYLQGRLKAQVEVGDVEEGGVVTGGVIGRARSDPSKG